MSMSYNRLDFGRKLKDARTYCKLTQAEAAELLHMSQSFYSQVETGRKDASIDFVVDASKIFGVSIDWLLGIEPTNNK